MGRAPRDAKKLTKDQTYGFVFPGINNEQGAFHTSTFVWSNGGNFEKLNSPENVERAHLPEEPRSTTARCRSRS